MLPTCREIWPLNVSDAKGLMKLVNTEFLKFDKITLIAFTGRMKNSKLYIMDSTRIAGDSVV